jgi:hypothetical protein
MSYLNRFQRVADLLVPVLVLYLGATLSVATVVI